MTTPPTARRVLAHCLDCDRVLAGNRWPNGTVNFIGQPDGCPCGGTDVRIVGDGGRFDGPADSDGDVDVGSGVTTDGADAVRSARGEGAEE